LGAITLLKTEQGASQMQEGFVGLGIFFPADRAFGVND
jgi:hypothetical protein